MADSVDRVFVHALNTVKKIPKTGASRPPATDRLRLYGLYKQAMEGDVDGVMERPRSDDTPAGNAEADKNNNELQRERDKWDAWNAQSGLSRVDAKRRYIEALIDTMHRYATTPDARELVTELEFVWNQIRNNANNNNNTTPSSSNNSSPSKPLPTTTANAPNPSKTQSQSRQRRLFQPPLPGTEGPMRVLSPMSEDDAAEEQKYRPREQDDDQDDEEDDDPQSRYVSRRRGGGDRWSRKVERALVRLSAEVAALREQITAGREWRSRKERGFAARMGWVIWLVARHVVVDLVVLGVVLLWMRRRRDRRLEDQVRAMVALGREYVRKVLPAR